MVRALIHASLVVCMCAFLSAMAGCALFDTSWRVVDRAPASTGVPTAGIVGVSNPHIWYDQKAYAALDAIKAAGFNAVRVVWETKGSGARLGEIIARCKALGLQPIPELHDITGGIGDTNAAKLDRMVDYWIGIKANLPADVWINIANEWGPADSMVWRDAYAGAIRRLRAAGAGNTLVIDSGWWGQDHADILRYAVGLLRQDANLVFSVHMYGSWNDNGKVDRFLDLCQAKGIPLLVGEFGYDHAWGFNNLSCRVDAAHVIAACRAHGVGYIGWSWFGNDQPNAWLDMTSDWLTLNTWGQLVRGTASGGAQAGVSQGRLP